MGSNTLVIYFSTYTRGTLYGPLTVVYNDMDILTAYCMLLLICAASSLTDNFQMCILGLIYGGCIGSVAVD
jgi:hypothetical protein